MSENIITPTEEEKANGWTTTSLTKYYLERKKAQASVINHEPGARSKARPIYQNSLYSPFKWR